MSHRILRGGGWNADSWLLRLIMQNWANPDSRYALDGFRLVVRRIP